MTSLAELRTLYHDLQVLGEVQAPALLQARTLAATGLADLFAPTVSPLGPVVVAYNGLGISAVLSAAPDVAERLRLLLGRDCTLVGTLPEAIQNDVVKALAGKGRAVRFDLRGRTEFERAVLLKALEIPRGEVRSYGWVAREIGRPKAVRAVGTALGHNPIPLLIPCHRVVRSDGQIGQYSLGGPQAKRTVLAAEGTDPTELEEWASHGVRYIGSDTTHIVCTPTCYHARRITAAHRISFGRLAEAEQKGFRPCKDCRPA